MGISFAPISAPQQVVRKRSDLDGLAELLLAVTQARHDIAFKREGLDLERQRTEASIAEGAARTASSKLDRKKKERELEVDLLKTEAADVAATIYQGMLSDPKGITPQAINEAKRATLSNPAHKKIAPYVLDELDDFIKDGEAALAQHATRRADDVRMRVSEGTEPEQVSKIKADASTAQTQAKNALVELDLNRVRKSIEEARLRFDPQRVGTAASIIGNGAPAGTAFRIAGVPLPAGVDPNYVLPNEALGKQSDAQRRAEGLLSGFRLARQQATAIGPVPLTFVNSVRARTKGDGLIGGTIASFANTISSENQQRLFNAYNTMAQMWRFHVSGAASALGEAAQLMQLIAPLTGDSPNATLGKAQLQNAIEESMSRVVGAEWNPQQAVDHLISVAKANKMDKKVLDALQRERVAAGKFMASPQARMRTGGAAVQGDALVTSRFTPSRP